MILQLAIKYPRAFGIAVALHLLVAVFFVVSFDWTSKPEQPEPEVNVVQATAVDESQVLAELAKIREIEARKQKREEDRVKKLESKADKAKRERQLEQKRIAKLEAERKKAAEQKRQADKAREQAEQQSKQAQEKAEIARQEKDRLESERAKAVEAQQQAQAERERLEKEAEAARERAKEEARKAEAARRKAEDDRLRQQMLDMEAKRLQEQRTKQVNSAIQKGIREIQNKIQRTWIRPVSAKAGMSCGVKVRIIPGGNVLNVKITKSSGDGVFDRSVETAVRRAAPLPLPKDASMFKHFREIEFTFNPS